MKPLKPGWVPYALLLGALLLVALDMTGLLTPLKTGLDYVIAPIGKLLAGLIERLGSLFKTVRDVQALQKKLSELQSQYNALLVENVRLRKLAADNETLRQELHFAEENPTYAFIGGDVIQYGCQLYTCAQVVGNDTHPYLRYLIINAGAQAGLARGMPVVTSGGVMVGRIARVTPHLAYVQLINDPGSSVAAMSLDTQAGGLVKGSEDGTLLMTEILPEDKVNVGDLIVTSGLGGLLPKGLVLGQVESVSYQESDLYQTATLRPIVDLNRLELVLVITEFDRTPLLELEETQP